jgi:hypothetical protein
VPVTGDSRPLALYFLVHRKTPMDKSKKNRSGSQSNAGSKGQGGIESRQQHQTGAPNSSSRMSKGHRKDDSSGAEKNTTKKQGNSI